ncbi:GOLPH3/VPS74 family protein [Prauserella cavernicola]|uniref:GPP34 family phosphoprotein n=1 Tax=Prauserella cavernicola TaxID=2800127 RepID=A0A934QZ22_9PSEU|nr:GPP34 family phosphoprotein [Prauserella cavernicola]MBK1789390.1 GPP34 family phosphoprotein [Prauserella cavernicola]
MNWTLPQQLYLLSYDLDKDKLDPNPVLVRGQLLRAAAVAELTIHGWLSDEDGKAVRDAALPPPGDAFLAEVLDNTTAGKPRSWFKIVDHRWDKAETAVRDQLAERGTITVKSRALGFLLGEPVVLEDRERVRALRESVRTAALLGREPADVPVADAALAMLAVEGDVRSLVTPSERRERKRELRALTDHLETVLPGLRKAIIQSIAARRAGAA